MSNSLINALISFVGGLLGGFIAWKISEREMNMRSLERKSDAIERAKEKLNKLEKEFVESSAKNLKEKERIDEETVRESFDPIAELFWKVHLLLDSGGFEIDDFYENKIKPISRTLYHKGIETHADSYALQKLREKYPLIAETERKQREQKEKLFRKSLGKTAKYLADPIKDSPWGIKNELDMFKAMKDLISGFARLLDEEYQSVNIQLHRRKEWKKDEQIRKKIRRRKFIARIISKLQP